MAIRKNTPSAFAASRVHKELPWSIPSRSRPRAAYQAAEKITLLPGQSPAEEFSTLAHEIAHELLHRGIAVLPLRVEFERRRPKRLLLSCAMPSGSNRVRQRATTSSLWNGDAQLLTESLAYIRQAASQMLRALTDS